MVIFLIYCRCTYSPTNVMGAGGSPYQSPGLGGQTNFGTNSNGQTGNWQRAVGKRSGGLSGPLVQLAAAGYPYDPPTVLDVDPKHGLGGYGGGSNAGALNVGEAEKPGGSFYSAGSTW